MNIFNIKRIVLKMFIPVILPCSRRRAKRENGEGDGTWSVRVSRQNVRRDLYALCIRRTGGRGRIRRTNSEIKEKAEEKRMNKAMRLFNDLEEQLTVAYSRASGEVAQLLRRVDVAAALQLYPRQCRATSQTRPRTNLNRTCTTLLPELVDHLVDLVELERLQGRLKFVIGRV